jgi:acyl carrier protein
MNETEAIRVISEALKKVTKKDIAFTKDTDLVGEEILDSLDGLSFVLEVETATEKKFPEDIDLVKDGYYRVSRLIAFLAG